MTWFTLNPHTSSSARDGDMKMGAGWEQPCQSAYDFRSDTVTSPTPNMLRAIVGMDFCDAWVGGPDEKILEDHISKLIGKESSMLLISSVMANQVGVWAHLDRYPGGVICDIRAHTLNMEGGSVAMLAGAFPQPVTPSNGLYMTLEDIKRKVVLMNGSKPASGCDCPTRVIHLENPLGGNIMPISEMVKIKRFAEEHNIKVNLDGARLWDVASAGAGTLTELSALADSVNLAFSKAIGAPFGSSLSGSEDFIVRAKGLQRSIGGHVRQPGILAVTIRAAMQETIGADPSGIEGKFQHSHDVAKRLALHWESLGGALLVPQETNIVWLDIASTGLSESDWVKGAKAFRVLLHSCRIVTHYQISDEAVTRLEDYMTSVLSGPAGIAVSEFPEREAVSRLAACMKDVYQQRKLV